MPWLDPYLLFLQNEGWTRTKENSDEGISEETEIIHTPLNCEPLTDLMWELPDLAIQWCELSDSSCSVTDKSIAILS